MTRYMLDTNTVSYLIKEDPCVAQRVMAVPMASLCISAITQAEMVFGLARRPDAKRLHVAVREFLRRVDVLPWNSLIAECYGVLRSDLERQGNMLASLDLLIAAHALGVGAALVTNDMAFRQVPNLLVENWTG